MTTAISGMEPSETNGGSSGERLRERLERDLKLADEAQWIAETQVCLHFEIVNKNGL